MLFFFSCSEEKFADPDTISSIDFGGKVFRIETLGEYSKVNAVALFQTIIVPGTIQTTTGFRMYRILYNTKNHDNTDLTASALVAVPQSAKIKGVVCWLHGTNPDRNSAPSKPSPLQGIDVAAVFAGNEYILIAPDYIGLGESQTFPTYMHKSSTVKASIDLIALSKPLMKAIAPAAPDHLFILGFSQGGSAAAAIQEELQKNNITGLDLKATAAVCGAFDLRNISMPYAIENNNTFYLGYIANSYSKIYNQSLETIIKPVFTGLIEQLFDGSHSYEQITSKLPATAAELYTEKMLTEIANKKSNWFTDALDENQNYRWKPVSPFRIYYGEKDKDVSPQDAINAYNYMKSVNGHVALLNTGQKDHVEALISSIPNIQQWFNSIRE